MAVRGLNFDDTRVQVIFSRVAIVCSVSGGIGSIFYLYRAGGQHDFVTQFVQLAFWGTSPFAALLICSLKSKNWSGWMQFVLMAVATVLMVGALAIYGRTVASPHSSRSDFPFVFVPSAAWCLILTVMPLSDLIKRRLSRFRLLSWILRAVTTGILSGIVAIAVSLGLLMFDRNSDTILPVPTGPFSVGRTKFFWTDSKSDPTAPPGSHRELLVWVWYPATTPQGAEKLEEYLPSENRIAMEKVTGLLLTQFLTRDLSRVKGHGFWNVGLSPEYPRYPVLLMRGGGSTPTVDYTTLAQEMASHGYIVVGFDAPYRCQVVVLPDGTAICRSPHNDLEQVGGSKVEELAERLANAWSADSSFVLDQLERIETIDPDCPINGRLDLQRVGMFGHSLGGATALMFCHDDVRCKAGIDVDGVPLGPVVFDGVTQPFLFLLSDHRGESVGSQSPNAIRNAMTNIRKICGRSTGGRKMIAGIAGANHFMFSDGAILRSPLALHVLRTLGVLRLDSRRQLEITAHSLHNFFDVYLNNAPASELERRLECPEIQIDRDF